LLLIFYDLQTYYDDYTTVCIMMMKVDQEFDIVLSIFCI